MVFQGILRYFRYPSIKLLRMQTYKRLLMGLEMEEYDPRSFLCEKGGACSFVQGLQIVIFVSLMIFRTERQLINPFKYRLISHLHGGVILLLRPQSS